MMTDTNFIGVILSGLVVSAKQILSFACQFLMLTGMALRHQRVYELLRCQVKCHPGA
jgi:hypothetical protein